MALTDEALALVLREAFAAVCETPIEALVVLDDLMLALDTLAAPERVSRWNDRVWNPLRNRLVERASVSEVRLGDWAPEGVIAWSRKRAAAPLHLPRRHVEAAVGSEKMREATRQMVVDALTSFVQKATSVVGERAPSQGGGGLFGALRQGAKTAGSVLGGLTEGFQQQLLERVRDQADGLVAMIQQKIVERVTSDETAKQLGKRRAALFEKLIETTEKQAVVNVLKAPWSDIDQATPLVLAHNLARAPLRAVIREETLAVLKALEGETVGSLLRDAGLDALAEAHWVRLGMPVARALDEKGLLRARPASTEGPDAS
ncbi:MAG: hypothetical protein JNK72_15795 [Myxococcales bacterium]|nr:hypothetical protein [Myxococcales bacterium]